MENNKKLEENLSIVSDGGVNGCTITTTVSECSSSEFKCDSYAIKNNGGNSKNGNNSTSMQIPIYGEKVVNLYPVLLIGVSEDGIVSLL